ncbi:DNA primase [Candidatus Falkowbacteria bacterium CG_4_10_14_0_2_um_filter_41_15]|uniref:DNA primase n=3 Tax=Candidatus Falkowiibacteriota TaxID=1752728 RepID=A0A1J4TAD1_9BACT|nr:MAG: DNA primase [Candidatus Falkowbacteria bacterium CG1_02_41_21]PIZ10405.1 MAG: DNA primase [Candidatus Falkowbacteria bacterium CG_4_10_14_0_8_um_filter_41_36]PJA09651.1 MAG: DNA primase [Candidatus Falkowbacteria bacterium CG_4_10_14_0_2_um_filter_41_15]
MNPAEEIKSKLDITEVLGEYISLRPAGGNLRAVCPFHQEKTPSFMVSPEKQIWHCFGCGRGGDIFGFVMEMEGLNFSEALRLLAPKAGVTLKREDVAETSKRSRLLDILAIAADYYHLQLFKNEAIKNYLKTRGLNEETVRNFKIGYSPDSWDDIINILKTKKYSDEEIFLAGLSAKKEGTAKYYNRFRDRIMFPINNVAGQTIGFSARVNPANTNPELDKMGKYINSPQTNVYDKSRVLFALDKAKQAIKQENLVIIVEGQMDAISSHQHGFKNTAASSGTALTGEQIKLIKRYTNNVALAFDADNAGQIAADRGIKEAMAAELDIKVIIIPGGKDPDEALKNNPAAWGEAIKAAAPMMEYYFAKVLGESDLTQASGKRLVAKKILEMINKFSNKIEIDHWLKRLSEKIDIGEEVLRETINTLRKPGEINNTPKISLADRIDTRQSREERLSELLLSLVLKYPDFTEYVANNLASEHLDGLHNRLFYNQLIIYYNTNKALDYRSFRGHLESQNPALASQLDTLSLLADKDFAEMDLVLVRGEIIKIILALKKFNLKNRMTEIEKQIASAENNNDSQASSDLMSKLKLLSEESKELDI